MIDDFHYSYAILGLITVASSLAAAFAQPVWGRLGDRYGPFKMLKIVAFFRAFLMLGWALALPSLIYMLPFQIIIGIVANAGLGLMSFNTLLNVVPNFGKTEALSLYSSLVNFASFIGNIISGLFVIVLAEVHFNFIGLTFNDYRIIFFITFLARLAVFYYVYRIKLEKSS
ncbi:MAG: MFS transporter, partial [Athalassotoga sp.]